MRIFTIPPSAESGTNSSGFSLLEILVALFLAALILGVAVGVNFEPSSRNQLLEAMDLMERAVRFGVDEATLRNRIVRLHFLLEETPQQLSLEYASDETFVLSKKILDWNNEDDLGKEEKEEQRKFLEDISKQFQPVDEFEEENLSLPEGVRVFGVGTSTLERLISAPEVSVFIYPSGEKDGALIVLGTEEEMASLKIEEFTLDFERSWIENPPSLSDDDDDEAPLPTPAQLKKSKDLFEKWLSP